MVLCVGALVCLATSARAAAPTLTFTVTPGSIGPGGMATLAWTATDADGCMAAGGWNGAREVTGSEPVSPTATASYRLDCTGPSGSVSKTLTLTVKGDECEQIQTCTLSGPSSSCLYPFTVPDPGFVRITLKPADPSSLTTQWRLLTEAGAPAPVCGSLLASTTRDCGPLPGGEYRLEVSPSAGTGTVAVGIQGLSGCDSTRVDCDQVVTDEITPEIDIDVFRFSVTDLEMVRITIKTLSGPLSPEWRVRRLGGTVAPSACDEFRRTVASDCGPLGAGDYQIQVKDEKRDATGTYALHFQRLTASAACDSTRIFCARTASGEIDPGIESDLLRLSVMDLERVRITVDPVVGGVQPEWRLLSEAGTPEATCGSFMNVRTADCGPLNGGDYHVFVKDDTSSASGTFEVTVNFLTRPCPSCGNGLVQTGEDCDPPGECCSPLCRFVAANAVCRASAGLCDLVEQCSGASAACPPDKVRPAEEAFLCRPAAGMCDLPETCDGRKAACPADGLRAAGSVCRNAAGDCDLPEICSGGSPGCPPDAKRGTAERCRLPTTVCDAAEFCDGASDVCPADLVAPAGTLCRPKAHACDAEEYCTGTSVVCPPNLLLPGGCGNGCVEAGETCGEPSLGECGARLACVDCACVPCAGVQLRCPAPPAGETSVESEVVLDAPHPVGAYTVDLSWDPTLLRLDAVAGGAAPEFAADPACSIDAAAGTARCGGSQTVRTDGPSGALSVARVRFAALASLAGRPRVGLQVTALEEPGGAPATLCAPAAECAVPECAADRDCAGAAPCAAPSCVDGGCTAEPLGGFEGIDCELARLLDDTLCGAEPLDARLARLIGRRAGKARRLLERVKTSEGKKRARLVHRLDRQLGGLAARVEQGMADRRTTKECAEVLGQALGRSRALVAGLTI